MRVAMIGIGMLAAVFAMGAMAMPGGHGHGAGARSEAAEGCPGMAGDAAQAHLMHAGRHHGMAQGGEHAHAGPMHAGPMDKAAKPGHRHGAQPPVASETPAKP